MSRFSLSAKERPSKAFRELVQNWRDGIIQSFKLSEQDFKVTFKENDDEIIYQAVASGSYQNSAQFHKCFGYIRWSRHDGAGTVEITNRQATLEPWHLSMGSTTKVNDANQIGTHGEGLKIALVVLMRAPQNHAVRCQSGGFKWFFNFTNQRRLVACLTRIKSDQARSTTSDSRPLPFEAIPNEDVQFLIGTISKGRNENGYPTERTEVTRDEFKRWTKGALFLHRIPEENIVKTRTGDLIIDPEFGGRLYLRGFLLKEATEARPNSMAKKMKYGYNFINGTTNRERDHITCLDEESRAILTLWESALVVRGDLVEELHKLLSSGREYADIQNTKDFGKDTKRRICSYIRHKFPSMWFHTASERSANHRFHQILVILKRKPLEVSQSYWAILEDGGFRTAKEELMERFIKSPIVPIPAITHNTWLFSMELRRLIRGGFEDCPVTTNTNVMFVKADSKEIESKYVVESKEFKINGIWSTREGAAGQLGQTRQQDRNSILLSAAQGLLRTAIAKIPIQLFHADGGGTPVQRRDWAIAQTSQRIDEVIHIQRATTFEAYDRGETYIELVVKWSSRAAWLKGCQVTLQIHRMLKCSERVWNISNGEKG
ncbi:hypothetical protein ABKA04_000463 [Annulohypoxylon sp. FPYF3050]